MMTIACPWCDEDAELSLATLTSTDDLVLRVLRDDGPAHGGARRGAWTRRPDRRAAEPGSVRLDQGR